MHVIKYLFFFAHLKFQDGYTQLLDVSKVIYKTKCGSLHRRQGATRPITISHDHGYYSVA